jgi:hypothetical protein
VIAGINLNRALEHGAPRTKQLVKVAAAAIVAEIVLFAAVASSLGGSSAALTGRAIGRALVPLLILWYIHASLRRLAKESQRRMVDTIANKFV